MLIDRHPHEDVFARVPELADQTDLILLQGRTRVLGSGQYPPIEQQELRYWLWVSKILFMLFRS